MATIKGAEFNQVNTVVTYNLLHQYTLEVGLHPDIIEATIITYALKLNNL